jgi:acyl-coenzyme A synthetase/AMP-(fatty) acid ligase
LMITQLVFDLAKQCPDKAAIIHNNQPFSYSTFAQLIAIARDYFARAEYVGPGYAVLAVRHYLSFWILSLALRGLGLTTLAVPGGAAAAQDVRKVLPVRCAITSPREIELLQLFSDSWANKSAELTEASDMPPPGGHILLTSGTTGTYKMVLMDEAYDAVTFRRRVEIFGIDQDSEFNVFDLAPWTGAGYKWPCSTWTAGGTVVIEQKGPLHGTLLRPSMTHAVATPPVLDQLLAAPAGAFPRNEKLQLAVVGGTMTLAQFEQAKDRITPRVLSGLGCTETGVIALTPLNTAEDRKWHQIAPRRIVQIVDQADHQLPTSEMGRLRIKTEQGEPTGYLGDEVATRTFFKGGFFYPGDLAVMRPDGRIALRGRSTDVINVQGLKIPAVPIEDRLAELLSVSGICLFSLQNDSGDVDIHVVIESSNPIGTERVMAALKQELRGLARACVHQFPALPRNQMGKVLRQSVFATVIANQAHSLELSLVD